MEFATGAMSSLLPKLGELLLEEYNLKEKVKQGIGDLKAELESIQAVLVKVSSVPLDQLDPQVKIWANEVRELSYAIEDSLDSFVARVDGVEPAKPKIKHLLKMARNECTKFKARHEIANNIKDIDIQVKKIKERYDRYKIDDVVANPAATTVDPRLSALYNKVSNLVGTDEPIDEIMKVFSEGVDTFQKNLKIVSIVGFGGLGKTTLAKALYDKLSNTYQFKGFVPVGQNQGTKKVLRDILLELDIKLYKTAATMDERQLINQLQKVLAGKRYFIVIDDIWDIQTWETIKCAFVDSQPESRIIITTRIVDVATRVGGIYHMKPLSHDNSKMLFQTRTCGGEGVSQDNQPVEVTNKILKKCGGVPLAIITIASLLVGKPSADWSKVYDAIGFGHEDSEVIQNTRKILSFSYYDLRPYLKTCLLYLGMYPEDKFIQKNSLIWRWVCEGFVLDTKGIGAFKLGESYYNELVNKNMIRQTTFFEEEGCRVHDLVLDLICRMSMEVNFVTVQDTRVNHITSSPNGQSNRVHRLAFHGSSVEHSPSTKMEHVRSLNAVTCGDSGVPQLSAFKVLRVLIIEDCGNLEGRSLEHLGKLVQLRYLGLVKTTLKLPEGIGHDLKFLEVLDVRGGLISELPLSVGELKNLRCLWASEGTRMTGEIGKLTCLEELQLYSVDKCPNFFTDLGKLRNLRVLKFHFKEMVQTAVKALVESLCYLSKIHSLVAQTGHENTVPCGSLEYLAPSSKLLVLALSCMVIPTVPSWINSSAVPLLSELRLHVEALEARDFQTLRRLSSLLILVLESKEVKRVSYTFGSGEFQKLECLVTNIEITLADGALPRLERLSCRVSVRRKGNLVPWNNGCPSLERVVCWLDCAHSGNKEVRAANEVLRKAGRTHPNAKDVSVSVYRENYDRDAAKLIDALGSILHTLDKPDGREGITADQPRDICRMIKSLETLLLDAAEPRVGEYGEQELRGIVTKLKSWLHDHAVAHQEETMMLPQAVGVMRKGRRANLESQDSHATIKSRPDKTLNTSTTLASPLGRPIDDSEFVELNSSIGAKERRCLLDY